MTEKLEGIEKRYKELARLLADPDVISDREQWQKYAKEHSDYEEVMGLYGEYKKLLSDIEGCEEIIKSGEDEELSELAKFDLEELKKQRDELEVKIKKQLLPADPDDNKNVIIEIRAGAGGEEAGLFGAVLQRMYTRYAERMRWKCEQLSINETDLGGVKESVFMISGKGAFSMLKYESGVHRVQRVPQTESQGRIHTSTVTVAVLPEVRTWMWR